MNTKLGIFIAGLVVLCISIAGYAKDLEETKEEIRAKKVEINELLEKRKYPEAYKLVDSALNIPSEHLCFLMNSDLVNSLWELKEKITDAVDWQAGQLQARAELPAKNSYYKIRILKIAHSLYEKMPYYDYSVKAARILVEIAELYFKILQPIETVYQHVVDNYERALEIYVHPSIGDKEYYEIMEVERGLADAHRAYASYLTEKAQNVVDGKNHVNLGGIGKAWKKIAEAKEEYERALTGYTLAHEKKVEIDSKEYAITIYNLGILKDLKSEGYQDLRYARELIDGIRPARPISSGISLLENLSHRDFEYLNAKIQGLAGRAEIFAVNALLYSKMGDYRKGLVNAIKAQKFAEKAYGRDIYKKSEVLPLIALLAEAHEKTKNYDKALEVLERANELFKMEVEVDRILRLNIEAKKGEVLMKKEEYTLALRDLSEVEKRFMKLEMLVPIKGATSPTENINFLEAYTRFLALQAKIYNKRNIGIDRTEALKKYDEAIDLLKYHKLKKHRIMAEVWEAKANLYLEMNQPIEAQICFKKARSIYKKDREDRFNRSGIDRTNWKLYDIERALRLIPSEKKIIKRTQIRAGQAWKFACDVFRPKE